jgi:hypothetical protein
MLLSSIVVASQSTAPAWVMARVLALVMLVYGGSVAVGSALWGYLSDAFSVQASIVIAVAGLLASVLLGQRYPIAQEGHRDLSQRPAGPPPAHTVDLAHERGPVMVTLDYQIDPARRDAVLDQLASMRMIRQRSGAYFWEVFDAPDRPGSVRETFLVESWLEYLRQRERLTGHDQAAEQRLLELTGSPPRERHFVASRGR